MSTLSDAMRHQRIEEGKSIRALGAWLNVSFSTLARIERGEGTPNLYTRIAIMQWLGWNTLAEEAQTTSRQKASLAALTLRVEVLESKVSSIEWQTM